MSKAYPTSVSPKADGEDEGKAAFVKPISSSRQIAGVIQCGVLHFVFDCSSIRPSSRFGCFPADCAFPHGDCRDVTDERTFSHGTCRDVKLGRPLMDIWRASRYLQS